jgi:PleD family two-component response regulator
MIKTKTQLLLIEDDDVDREVVHRLLLGDYIVYDAPTGKQALSLVQQMRPDCVLLDYRLPDVDGFELLSVCVRDDIPVVVLTGEESPEVIVKAMQQGAQDYLVKDHISRASLDHAVTNAIEKVTLRIELEEKQRRLVIQAADLAAKNKQVRELASALTLAEQRERRRISQILHDNVQQMLYGVQMRAHLIGMDVDPTLQSEIQEHVDEIDLLVKEAIQATRTLTI